MEEQAALLGDPPRWVMRRVTLPLAAPGLHWSARVARRRAYPPPLAAFRQICTVRHLQTADENSGETACSLAIHGFTFSDDSTE